jgi:hypothetical protein
VADDSVEDKTEAQTEKPSGPTAIVVRNRDGGVREALKNEKGQFVKKPKRMPETREVTRIIRNILNMPVADVNGKIDRKGKKAIEEMVGSLIQIVLDGQNGKGPDRMAAVQAFEALMLRGHGKPQTSDADMESMQLSGVKYVVIQAPENMMKSEVIDVNDIKKPIQPSFINDVEFLPPDRNKE